MNTRKALFSNLPINLAIFEELQDDQLLSLCYFLVQYRWFVDTTTSAKCTYCVQYSEYVQRLCRDDIKKAKDPLFPRVSIVMFSRRALSMALSCNKEIPKQAKNFSFKNVFAVFPTIAKMERMN
jgi:hypothetical protein